MQLSQSDICADVAKALEISGIDPGCLVIELTESVLMHQVESVMQTLHGLSDLGIRIAIDDFGTGYSSLAYLRRLAIDKLKIDRSFIRDLSIDPEDSLIVATIIRMAHSLPLKVRCRSA